MGTRSLTFVHSGNLKSPVLMCMYRQMDSYFEGHGEELKEFLETISIVNGIGLAEKRKVANGMGCLAAQLVSHFKGDGVGGFYLYPIDSSDCGEEYVYHIYLDGDYYGDNKNCKLKLMGKHLYDGVTKHFLGGAPEKIEYKEIAEFVYPSFKGEPVWRRIGVLEEDANYIKGNDFNNGKQFKCFSKSKIVGNKIIRDTVS